MEKERSLQNMQLKEREWRGNETPVEREERLQNMQLKLREQREEETQGEREAVTENANEENSFTL